KKNETLEKEVKELEQNKIDYDELNKNFDFELNKQISPLKLINKILEKENIDLKTSLEENNTFMDKVKKYYGDKFEEWKNKVSKPKGGYKI
ncbi:hypothetical protein ABCX32_004532, partial [Salmonella enterica]